MKYNLWVVALLEACDVTNKERHLGRRLEWILPRIRNQVKIAKKWKKHAFSLKNGLTNCNISGFIA